MPDTLGLSAINRATLHRQGLLERATGVVETIEHLIGMQAQNPLDPYYALWARLDDFQPTELSTLLTEGRVVRAAMMRATIHLLTTDDYLRLRPVMASVPERVFRSTAFAKDTAGVDEAEVLALASDILLTEPRTRAHLAAALGERWPEVPKRSLAQMATYLLPVVQVPPRGVWGFKGPARWALSSHWLGSEFSGSESMERLVTRYLGAFGPATPSDMRIWSGLTGLREIFDGMRPRLRTWRDENGAELLDLPDVEHPEPDMPAPPRLLPEYDNLLLGHADRSRFFRGGMPLGFVGNLLVDGFFAGSWAIEPSKSTLRIVVTPQIELSPASRAQVEEEGYRLVEVLREDREGVVDFRSS